MRGETIRDRGLATLAVCAALGGGALAGCGGNKDVSTGYHQQSGAIVRDHIPQGQVTEQDLVTKSAQNGMIFSKKAGAPLFPTSDFGFAGTFKSPRGAKKDFTSHVQFSCFPRSVSGEALTVSTEAFMGNLYIADADQTLDKLSKAKCLAKLGKMTVRKARAVSRHFVSNFYLRADHNKLDGVDIPSSPEQANAEKFGVLHNATDGFFNNFTHSSAATDAPPVTVTNHNDLSITNSTQPNKNFPDLTPSYPNN